VYTRSGPHGSSTKAATSPPSSYLVDSLASTTRFQLTGDTIELDRPRPVLTATHTSIVLRRQRQTPLRYTYPQQRLQEQHDIATMSAQIKSTPASTSSSATNSTEVSPAFYRFEDPIINGQLTPLTSVDNTPVNEKEDSDKLVQVKDVCAAGGQVQEGIDVDVPPTELEILQARVKESCEGRTQKVEAWGHRGASATCPENTMASFRATCEAGAQGIETGKHACCCFLESDQCH
jgi:hypothetical protein